SPAREPAPRFPGVRLPPLRGPAPRSAQRPVPPEGEMIMRRLAFLIALLLSVRPLHAVGVTISTASLPGGELTVLYSSSVAATGGTQPYTWSISAGALPPGITLQSSGFPDSVRVRGTPTTTGTYNFTVRATDSSGLSAFGEKAFTVRIYDPIAISTTTVPDGE